MDIGENRSLRVRLAAVLGVAAAYFVTGKLGLLLAIPPGYATAVWLPSGVALAGILIFGYRAWPGVLLGSFCVNVGVSFDASSTAAILSSLIVAASIGAGATLQGLAGAYLVRRFVGFPSALDDERDVGRFLILGGPLSSLVNATWSVSTLLAAGIVSADSYGFNWFTWWVGDSIGILIVTPLVLAWAGEPRDGWRRRRITVTVPLCAAFVIAAAFFIRASAWEQERIHTEFVQRADAIGDALKASVARNLEVLEAIGDFHAGSPSFDWRDFRAFVAGPLARYPGFRAVSWNPRVLDPDRANQEAALQREGFAAAGITERNAHGQLVPAARRGEYIFVRYIEPVEQNRPALGYDVGSEPTRREALDRARDSGKPIATARIQLVQDDRAEPGFLVFLPVYRDGLARATEEERRAALLGYMTGVFRVADLVASSAKNVDPADIEVQIRDTSAPAGEQLLYSNRRPRHPDATDAMPAASKAIAHDIAIEAAGRRWVLTVLPTSRYLDAHRGWQAWTILAAGLLFTGLLGAFLLVITGRTTRMEQLAGRVARLNRVYAVLGGINALIVRVRNLDELFRESCRIAVEAGKLPFAWIGVVNRDAMQLEPVAWAGDERDFVAAVRPRLSLSETASEGRSLVARAVLAKQAMISNDVANDPRIAFKQEHAERGSRSLAAFPLIVSDRVAAVFALHAAELGFFDDEELRLLRQLAGDISFALEHIEKTERLDYLAYYDSITGLANRTFFHERLQQYVAEAGRSQRTLAVLIVDIERFRTINDTLGRRAGDALLKQMGARFLDLVGDPGEVARLGADQFAAVIPDVRLEADLVRIIEKARERLLGKPFSVEGTELRIATKAGIALFPTDGADAETLLRNAEAALQKAKASGERHVFYTQRMTERVAEKLTLENKLRQAVEKNEFVLHYQPKLDLETRAIVGVEALIRWQSPEFGLVPPGKFIALLEETGLILEVGSWALTRAALDHRAWVEAGLRPPRVAVNVSPIQLRQRDFVSIVERAVMEGVSPVAIDLEITESLIMEDVEATIEKLKNVQALGIKTAIDDFGTGYSSLAYLAKLPVEALKIDRSFVIKMLDDPDTATLVQTVITLAHSLKLTVVAEGVDSEEQAKVLRLLRCDQMQGYLFSKPLPEDEWLKLLRGEGSAR